MFDVKFARVVSFEIEELRHLFVLILITSLERVCIHDFHLNVDNLIIVNALARRLCCYQWRTS